MKRGDLVRNIQFPTFGLAIVLEVTEHSGKILWFDDSVISDIHVSDYEVIDN